MGAPEIPAMPEPMPQGNGDPSFMSNTMMGVETMPPIEEPNKYEADFDAGVEANEETDPKKYIQQLTGKLSQSLRKYNQDLPQTDADLNKYVAGMVVKQCIEGLEPEDVQDILKKINNDEEEETLTDKDKNLGDEQPNTQTQGSDEQTDMAPPMNENTKAEDTSKKIDHPSNTHYAVNKQNKLIVNAWQYNPKEYGPTELKQFAKDYFFVDLEDYGFNPKEYKILTRKGCISQGIDPSNDENWSNDGVTPCNPKKNVNETVTTRQSISSIYEELMGGENKTGNEKVTNKDSYHKRPWLGKTFKA